MQLLPRDCEADGQSIKGNVSARRKITADWQNRYPINLWQFEIFYFRSTAEAWGQNSSQRTSDLKQPGIFKKFSSNLGGKLAALQVRSAARRRAVADDGGAAPWMSCPDTHILESRLCEQCCVPALVRALTLLCGWSSSQAVRKREKKKSNTAYGAYTWAPAWLMQPTCKLFSFHLKT